jgi:hypothetical protein
MATSDCPTISALAADLIPRTTALTVVAESINRRGQFDKQFQQPIILPMSFPSCMRLVIFQALTAF